MSTRQYTLEAFEFEKGNTVLRMKFATGGVVRLTHDKIDAAHSNSNKLIIQSGDAFLEITCDDAPQAMRFASWCMGNVLAADVTDDDAAQVVRESESVEAGMGKYDHRVRHLAEQILLSMIKGRGYLGGGDPADKTVDLAFRMAKRFVNKGEQ